MKTVILDFKDDEQAEKFFNVFAGITGEVGIKVTEEIEKSVDVLFGYCGVESVSTKAENAAYTILAS